MIIISFWNGDSLQATQLMYICRMNTSTELNGIIGSKRPRSLVGAVMAARCPQCREGDFFAVPWYNRSLLKIHDHCPKCGAQFEPEPGFFIGAMYVNYAFNIMQLIVVGLFVWLVIDPDNAWWIVAAVLGVTFATIPFTARMSRVIWLYMFGELRYDPRAADPRP
jgi:uncharacterized protein (DUF983 family)